MATFQEVRAQAQQGNTDAIATLLNYALKKDNLQTKVKASGSCLTVYIRGQQAPDSSLVPA
jgi:GTP cyclohydrolase I